VSLLKRLEVLKNQHFLFMYIKKIDYTLFNLASIFGWLQLELDSSRFPLSNSFLRRLDYVLIMQMQLEDYHLLN
ncbi:MAG: hypothetical protein ACLTPG_04790, partial [Mediterraneibacter gnavus]